MSEDKKMPWMQFFGGDWMKDSQLSMCEPSTRGIWIDLIWSMHATDRSGLVSGSIKQLARLCRCEPQQFALAMKELTETKTADLEECNGIVTVINRRMRKEYIERENTKKRAKDKRDRDKSNANVTQEVTQESRHCNATEYRVQSTEYRSLDVQSPDVQTFKKRHRQDVQTDDDDNLDISQEKIQGLTSEQLRIIEDHLDVQQEKGLVGDRFKLKAHLKKLAAQDPSVFEFWWEEILDHRQNKAKIEYQALQKKTTENVERIDAAEREKSRKNNQIRVNIFEKFKQLPEDERDEIRVEALEMAGQISVMNDFILIAEITKIFETKYPKIVAELSSPDTKIPELEKIIETQKIEIEKIKIELDFHMNISNGLLKHAQGKDEKEYNEFTDLVSDYCREALDKDDHLDRNVATIYARVNAGKQKFPEYFNQLQKKIKETAQ